MAKSSKGTVIERVPGAGHGKVRLDDGREIVFDVDAVDRFDLPETGESVRVALGPSRLGGEKVVKLTRVRVPRPSLDAALTLGASVPVGREDQMTALHHWEVGTLSLEGGLSFGDLLGGDKMERVADPTDASAKITAIFQGDDIAFARLDVVPFQAGCSWGRRKRFTSDSASFCLVPPSEIDALTGKLEEIERQLKPSPGVALLSLGLLWVEAPDGSASVRSAIDTKGNLAILLLDLGVCATK